MPEDDRNYGRQREPGDEAYEAREETREMPGRTAGGPVVREPSGGTLVTQDEKTWSVISHVSGLVWPLTGFLPIVPLVIWLVYRERSPVVGFHALQSLWYQVAWLGLGVAAGVLSFFFVAVTLGAGALLVVPLWFLSPLLVLVAIVHQLYAAYKVGRGDGYRYPFIADAVDGDRRRLP